MSNEFTWTRYWLPSGSELVVGFDGYIAAPDSKFGRALAPNLAKLEELADVRCLVLEGEAGMGKTTVLRETAGHLRTRGLNCREVNLAEWSSESLLVQELFRDAGAGPVHLFLDSLDECPIPNISLILARELRSRTIDSLRLRIACRTGSWPAALGDSLKRIWGDDVRYLELMPLTRADARVAANSRGIDPSRFDEAVASRNAQPLAMKPITLTMLLDEFERTDALPESQLALYRMGCLALCHESSASRRDVGRVGDLGEAERLAIAARVAAVCVFTGKHLISSGKGPGELDAKVVTIQELASGIRSVSPVTDMERGVG